MILARDEAARSEGGSASMPNFPYVKGFAEWEKFLPNQHVNSRLYEGPLGGYLGKLYGSLSSELSLQNSIERWNLESPEEWSVAEMASGRLHLHLICFLVGLVGARRVLEIGTFVGLSALELATVLPEGGEVVTVEVLPKYRAIAERNIKKNRMESAIKVLEGDALDLLRQGAISGNFDFAFIDGDKGRYLDYVREILPRMNRNGLIAVDDVFFQGDVFNQQPQTDKGAGVRRCIEWAARNSDLEVTFVPISNGLMLVRKRGGSQRLAR